MEPETAPGELSSVLRFPDLVTTQVSPSLWGEVGPWRQIYAFRRAWALAALWCLVLFWTCCAISGGGRALIALPQWAQQEADITEHTFNERTLARVAVWGIFCSAFFCFHSGWLVEYCGGKFSCSLKPIVLWLNLYFLRRLWPIQKILCLTFECRGGQGAGSHRFVFIRSIYHTVLTLSFV